MADLVADKDLFELANMEADRIINEENFTEKNEYKHIVEIIHENYENNKEMLD